MKTFSLKTDLLDPPSSVPPSMFAAYRIVVREWQAERREFTRDEAVEEMTRRAESKRSDASRTNQLFE